MSALTKNEIDNLLTTLDKNWHCQDNMLQRKFSHKNYSQCVYNANMIAALCAKHNHHADISFGWGYCCVAMKSHDINALSSRDFNLAKAIDKAVLL